MPGRDSRGDAADALKKFTQALNAASGATKKSTRITSRAGKAASGTINVVTSVVESFRAFSPALLSLGDGIKNLGETFQSDALASAGKTLKDVTRDLSTFGSVLSQSATVANQVTAQAAPALAGRASVQSIADRLEPLRRNRSRIASRTREFNQIVAGRAFTDIAQNDVLDTEVIKNLRRMGGF